MLASSSSPDINYTKPEGKGRQTPKSVRIMRRLGGRKERLSQKQGSWPEGGGLKKGLQGRIKCKAHVSRGTVVWPLTVGREVSGSSSHRMIGIFRRKVHGAVHCPQWSQLWLQDNVGHLAIVFPLGEGQGRRTEPLL